MNNYTEKELMAEYGDTELETLKEQYASLHKQCKALQKELNRYKDDKEFKKVKTELLLYKKIVREEDRMARSRNGVLERQNKQLRKSVRLLAKHLETHGFEVKRTYNSDTGETLYVVKEPEQKDISDRLNTEEVAFLRKLISKLKEE